VEIKKNQDKTGNMAELKSPPPAEKRQQEKNTRPKGQRQG
jgi:hypothetical protein